jgi:hypothetical protein
MRDKREWASHILPYSKMCEMVVPKVGGFKPKACGGGAGKISYMSYWQHLFCAIWADDSSERDDSQTLPVSPKITLITTFPCFESCA